MTDCQRTRSSGLRTLVQGPAGERITTPPAVQTWLPGAPVIPGQVWCWSHQQWEPTSDEEK